MRAILLLLVIGCSSPTSAPAPAPSPAPRMARRPAERPQVSLAAPATDAERQVCAELAGLGLEVTDCSCGSSTCRAQITHPSRMDQDRFMAMVGLPEPFDEGTQVYKRFGPDLRTTVFLAREGYELEALP